MLGFLMLSKEQHIGWDIHLLLSRRLAAAVRMQLELLDGPAWPLSSSSWRSGLLSMIISEQPEDKNGGFQPLEARAQESQNACFLWAKVGHQATADSQKEHTDSISCWERLQSGV